MKVNGPQFGHLSFPSCSSPNPELLNLQLVLVQLVAEVVVLLIESVDGTAVLHCHLGAVLQLQPQDIYRLLSVVQLQPQCFSFCMQDLATALDLFQPGKTLDKVNDCLQIPSKWEPIHILPRILK